MEGKKYAFVDEFGAFGFDFDKAGCSTHFIVSAIVVDEKDLQFVSDKVEEIRKKYFQTAEMKSSKVKKNHKRRQIILNELKNLPFNIFALVFDKRKIYEQSGLRHKKSFYKFINNLVYQELRINYSNLQITADEVGENDYLKSFASYVRSKQVPITLFDDSSFTFSNSKQGIIVQVADIISGSLAYNFDEKKKKESEGNDYLELMSNKILRIKQYPETYNTFEVIEKNINPKYNKEIADICFRKAKYFIEIHKESKDIEIKQQIAVLDYLLFRFMNKSMRKYIPTKELIDQLVFLGYDRLSIQAFRNKIIAKLRDNEVIISSSKSGYKIPSTEEELYDFILHGKSIILPMLSRLKSCSEIIRMGTNGKINLFEKAEYQSIASLLSDNQKK